VNWFDAPVLLINAGGCEKLASKAASLTRLVKVIDALRTAGCTGLKELDVETDEYEVGRSL